MTVDDPKPRSRRARIYDLIRRGFAFAVLAVVLIGIYVYWTRTSHAPEQEQAAGPQGPMPVDTLVIEAQAVPMVATFLGQTEASQTVNIRARVSGYLTERAFNEGETVEQGQLLFRIDPEPFEVALAQAQANLESAQARLERAGQQVRRYESLIESDSATLNELEEWQTEQRVTAADVELQRARVEQAQLDLGYTTIESPITGVIGQALQDVGSYISAGGNADLAIVRQVEPIYVTFSVSERDLLEWQRLVASGQVAQASMQNLDLELTLPDERIYPHTGQLDFVDVTIDPSTGTALMRGTVPNPEKTLLPGQFVHVSVLGVERLNTVMVPQSAVMQTPAGASVYVVNDEGMVEMRQVTLGNWYEDQWIIESGLEPGARVVINRLMQIRPGMPVVEASEVAAASPATQPTAAARQ